MNRGELMSEMVLEICRECGRRVQESKYYDYRDESAKVVSADSCNRQVDPDTSTHTTTGTGRFPSRTLTLTG